MRPIDQIDYPRDAGEYWTLTEHHKDVLQNLIAYYHPSYRRKSYHGRITATEAERVCEAIRKQIQEEERDADPQQEFRAMLKRRDRNIVGLLNEVWFGMPESMESRKADGFQVLCDLCSECGVLYTDEEMAVFQDE